MDSLIINYRAKYRQQLRGVSKWAWLLLLLYCFENAWSSQAHELIICVCNCCFDFMSLQVFAILKTMIVCKVGIKIDLLTISVKSNWYKTEAYQWLRHSLIFNFQLIENKIEIWSEIVALNSTLYKIRIWSYFFVWHNFVGFQGWHNKTDFEAMVTYSPWQQKMFKMFTQ